MKRLFILMLALILLSSTAIAESAPAREFTVDEQAYDAYLDISYVHNQSIRYLSELGRLWDLANDLDDISDADELWFHAGLVANFGNSDSENGSRLLKFHLLATEKYGFNQVPDLYPAFKTFLSAYSGKTTDIIWAGLAMGIEAQYLISPDELKTYLDEAMQGIRSIMSKDREYPFLKELQNYYKEASYLLDYISDFEDNYIDCQEMLDTQKKNQSSYTIDFEFIFDPADFDYVMEVGAAEAEEKNRIIYDRAFSLENSGDYAGAIDLYWQCNSYNDSIERISFCHTAKNEYIYQLAIEKQHEGNYAEALSLLELIFHYKDSQEKYFLYSYQFASHLETQGCYQDAIKIYNTIPNYRDSKDRAEACQTWAFVEPYGIRLGTKLTIHDWGIGEVVRISDKIYTGTTTSSNGTKTHQYVQIWVNYPSKGEMWHHIPDHFEYGLKVVTSGN